MEELIKAALKKAGLDEELWKFIKVEKQEEIEVTVKAFAADVDRRVTAALKTRADNEKKKSDEEAEKKRLEEEGKKKRLEEEGKKKDTPPDDKLSPELQTFMKTVTESISKLSETVNKVNSKVAEKDRMEIVKQAITAAKLPESWATRVTESEPDGIADQVKVLKAEHEGIIQSGIDEKLHAGTLPRVSATAGESVSEATVKDYARSKNKDSGGTGQFPSKINVDGEGKVSQSGKTTVTEGKK